MKDFIDQYVKVLKNYAVFEGRATRSEFWKFFLVSVIVGFVIGEVSDMLGSLYGLAVLIPSLAVGARRLHDIGKSGWWQLIAIIPLLGWIILIVFLASESEGRDNKYGPSTNTKAGEAPQPAPMAESSTPVETTHTSVPPTV